MYTRYFALILGIIFLLVGVMGFIPGLVTHDHAAMESGVIGGSDNGYLLGLFHVNWVHSLIHVAFGIWGIVAYMTLSASILYSRVVAIAYGVLAVLGLIPQFHTMFGFVPIHGNDVWLHAAIAVVAAVFGWAHVTHDTHDTTTPHTPHTA